MNNLTPEMQARLDKWRAGKNEQKDMGNKNPARPFQYEDGLKTWQEKELALWNMEVENNQKRNK